MVRDEADEPAEEQVEEAADPFLGGYASFEELMNAARAGSQEAMGTICRHFLPIIEVVIRRHLLPEERRSFTMGQSSVIQQTLCEVYLDFPAFSGGTIEELNAWVLEIARHNCLDAQRQRSAPSVRMLLPLDDCGGEELLKAVACRETPATRAEQVEERRRVASAMECLSPLAQRVLTLRFGDGRSFEEVGRHVRRSAKASQKICERALAKLRQKLKHRQASLSRRFDNLVRSIWP